MHACVHACMHLCMHVRMHVCMYECMNVCMYVCNNTTGMYVCTCYEKAPLAYQISLGLKEQTKVSKGNNLARSLISRLFIDRFGRNFDH